MTLANIIEGPDGVSFTECRGNIIMVVRYNGIATGVSLSQDAALDVLSGLHAILSKFDLTEQ